MDLPEAARRRRGVRAPGARRRRRRGASGRRPQGAGRARAGQPAAAGRAGRRGAGRRLAGEPARLGRGPDERAHGHPAARRPAPPARGLGAGHRGHARPVERGGRPRPHRRPGGRRPALGLPGPGARGHGALLARAPARRRLLGASLPAPARAALAGGRGDPRGRRRGAGRDPGDPLRRRAALAGDLAVRPPRGRAGAEARGPARGRGLPLIGGRRGALGQGRGRRRSSRP